MDGSVDGILGEMRDQREIADDIGDAVIDTLKLGGSQVEKAFARKETQRLIRGTLTNTGWLNKPQELVEFRVFFEVLDPALGNPVFDFVLGVHGTPS